MKLADLKTPLEIKDIDFRVQSINKGGYATILAYKDARVDMNRLDDVVGPENWQRDHKEIKGVIYCGIGINISGGDDIDVPSQWVWKWDAGTESMTEKQKGEASDSFKRAGFNWGIGRELYDYPIIQIKLLPTEFDAATNKPTWNFKLKEWTWQSEFKDGKLIELTAFDQAGALRYNMNKTTEQKQYAAAEPKKIPAPKRLTPEQVKLIPTSEELNSLLKVLATYTLTTEEKSMIDKRINELKK